MGRAWTWTWTWARVGPPVVRVVVGVLRRRVCVRGQRADGIRPIQNRQLLPAKGRIQRTRVERDVDWYELP